VSTARLKQLLAVAVGLVAVAAAWTTLGRLGDVVEAMGRGADPATGFTPATGVIGAVDVEWAPDARDLFRPVDDAVRRSVGESYLAGLAILDGDPATEGVDASAYLTGPAQRALSMPAANLSTDRRHRLRVLFHSADGQIIEAEDRARVVWETKAGEALARTEVATVVLVQVDGTWHVRHRVVTEATTVLPSAGRSPTAPNASSTPSTDPRSLGHSSAIWAVAAPASLAALALAWVASIFVTRTRSETTQEEST
jgi:hypothetical protein